MRKQILYDLSDLDRLAPHTLVKCFLFYKLQDNIDQNALINVLKQGLKNAIENFPVMAGDLHVDDCSIPFVVLPPGTHMEPAVEHYASDKHATYDELQQRSFHPDDLKLEMLLPKWPTDRQPVCVMQLNFIKGGLIIACAAHHFVVDWNSLNKFLVAVFQSSKACMHGGSLPTFPACLNRQPYNGRLLPQAPIAWDILLQHLHYRIVNSENVNCHSIPAASPEYQMRLYRICEGEISLLKEKCTPTKGVSFVSSFDCLAAALWISVTRARIMASSGHISSQSRLVHTMDMRARDPDRITSPNYFGNAAILTQAGPLSYQELTEDFSIATAASAIRRNINQTNISILRDIVSLTHSLPTSKRAKYDVDFEATDFLVNSWFSGNADEYDFGVGRPEAFRPKPNPINGAFCVVLPNFGKSTRTYDLLLQLRVEEHEILLRDKFFNDHFKPLVYSACEVEPKIHKDS